MKKLITKYFQYYQLFILSPIHYNLKIQFQYLPIQQQFQGAKSIN